MVCLVSHHFVVYDLWDQHHPSSHLSQPRQPEAKGASFLLLRLDLWNTFLGKRVSSFFFFIRLGPPHANTLPYYRIL
jgi:hypothetical protein